MEIELSFIFFAFKWRSIIIYACIYFGIPNFTVSNLILNCIETWAP